jgi:two-component sensor histidine kinase
LETEVTCKNGSKKTISWGSIIINEDHYSYGLDLTDRKLAEKALHESLNEKDALFREIHHRVKNNLQIISSLLRLQSGKIDNQIANAVLRDMQSRVRSMALIHDHLYRSDNLAEVDLATYLDQLCHQLLQALVETPGTIRLHLDLAPYRMNMDQAIHCGLLVNELVSNALKHAFPDNRNGEVRVELHPLADNHGWRLRVADNGIGLPPGFSIEHLSSLGLKLVSDLTHQIQGHLQIETGQGAAFAIEFKTIPASAP